MSERAAEMETLKARWDVRELAGRVTTLRRASATEMAGPCPRCGGEDRFHCTQRWFFCRQCHPQRGDLIDFVRWLHGVDFRGALALLGAEQVVTGYAARRRFESPRRMLLFVLSVLIFSVITLTGMLYYQRVFGADLKQPRWETSEAHYREISRFLDESGAGAKEVVMVNNPPGFWLASGRPAIVIPYGNERTLIAAALRYRARYVILETNNPRQLSDLYHNRVSPLELKYMASVGSTKLFLVQSPGE